MNSKTNSSASHEITQITKEGYLYRRSHKRLRIWVRRWFVLDCHRIYYATKKSNSFACNLVPLIEDIRLCNVRANNQIDRKFVFEIKSVLSHYILQAESSSIRQSWIDTINFSISESLRNSGSLSFCSSINCISSINDGSISMLSYDSMGLKSNMILDRKERVIAVPGNDKCADCSATGPDWVSINIGIFLCMKCSGIHRSLGVNISKIRSFHMDDWDLETIIVLSDLGNTRVNKIFEAELFHSKPCHDSELEERCQFIRSKYEKKLFISKLSEINTELANQSILLAASSKNGVPDALQALVDGADVNCKSVTGETPLICAIKQHSISMVEFLLLNNASTSVVDNDGVSPLHHAVSQSVLFRCQVISLIKRNAACNILDYKGYSPLDYALQRKDPDVVTWLRLVNLHRELEADDPNIEKSFLPFLEDPAYLLELVSMFPV